MNFTMDGYTLTAIIVIGITACSVAKYFARAINISSQGWPPEHLDADGDHVEREEKSNA